MVVQHNLTAMNTNRMLGITTGKQAKSSEKLSSGYKINRAADDAAGLSISEKMRSQIRGLNKASSNAQDGISMIQTAEGALNEVHSILQRMNELATQAANDTNTEDDRKAIQAEIDQLATEIDRVAETTQFNTQNLLDGTKDGVTNGNKGVKLQVGASGTASGSSQVITVTIANMKAAELKKNGSGVAKGTLDVTSHTGARDAMDDIQDAIQVVSTQRSNLGALQNRLEHTISNLDNVSENTSAAESRIRDTDMASEMVEFSKNNILAQAGQSMLAQANQSTQGVLSLLQ